MPPKAVDCAHLVVAVAVAALALTVDFANADEFTHKVRSLDVELGDVHSLLSSCSKKIFFGGEEKVIIVNCFSMQCRLKTHVWFKRMLGRVEREVNCCRLVLPEPRGC